MIFLIHYNKKAGEIVEMRQFNDADRHDAENARLAKEIELRRAGIDNEVILLEASSEEALRKTHRRYFENIKNLLTSTSSQIKEKGDKN